MKILQLHDEKWDSGIAHYAVTLSAALRARSHEVLFWGAAGSSAVKEARRAGLEVRAISNPWVAIRALRRDLADRGIELINAHTGSSHSLAALLSAGTKIRVVRTRGDTRSPSSHFLSRALARRTTSYIAANKRLRDQLLEAYPEAKVEVVFQGLAQLGRPATLPEAPATIGLLGRLDPVKGHYDLLAAAGELKKAFPAVRFLCAGADTSERLEDLEESAKRLGLDGTFRFLGRVPDAAAFINSCRIGVIASTGSEAVSRAALEWMQLGRPVVATTVGCLPDLVEDGKTGLLVPPGSPRDLAQALRRLLADGTLAAEMGRRGRERFEARFSLESFASATEKVYAAALK